MNYYSKLIPFLFYSSTEPNSKKPKMEIQRSPILEEKVRIGSTNDISVKEILQEQVLMDGLFSKDNVTEVKDTDDINIENNETSEGIKSADNTVEENSDNYGKVEEESNKGDDIKDMSSDSVCASTSHDTTDNMCKLDTSIETKESAVPSSPVPVSLIQHQSRHVQVMWVDWIMHLLLNQLLILALKIGMEQKQNFY